MIDIWKSRYTVRKFTDDSVDINDIEYLSGLFEYIPIQQGVLNHFWLRLGPADQDIKNFMYEHIAHTKDKSEHMYAICSAPYVFVAITHGIHNNNGRKISEEEQLINIGFHAGALLADALRIGYDVSQVGCMEGKNNKKVAKKFSNLIRNCFTEEQKSKFFINPKIVNNAIFLPRLAICVGTGMPLTPHIKELQQGYPTLTGQKTKKTMSNLIIRTPSE